MVRKLAHRILNVSVARTYVPYQDLENKAMLVGILDSPHDFFEHLRRYTASLTTQMAFGFRAVSTQDPRFQEAFNVSLQSPLSTIERHLYSRPHQIFDRSSELIASRVSQNPPSMNNLQFRLNMLVDRGSLRPSPRVTAPSWIPSAY